MDVSRQTGLEDTSCASTSMYLSFDAESTVSSAAFKTLEASTVSEMELEAEISAEHSQESHLNSTLEARDVSRIPCNSTQLTTIKRVEQTGSLLTAASSPFPHTYPKNILHEYKALCSTPSKEQLLRNVEIVRGSSAEGCIEFGLAFLNMDEQKQLACFPPPPPTEENKENTHPESEEGSISSVSSVEIVTSVIERKMMMLPTTSEEQTLDELEQGNVKIGNSAEDIKEDIEITDTDTQIVKEKAQPLRNNTAASFKPKRSILAPTNLRKSVCEPDLKLNRPARILINAKKRTSLSHTLKINTEKDKTSEIPKLLNKILKISDAARVDQVDIAPKCKTSTLIDTRKSVAAVRMNTRSSKLPTIGQTEKRAFNFTQRMSVVVKTTLNSPARKMARRSALPNQQQVRRSFMPTKLDVPSTFTGIAMRKSMLPVGISTLATKLIKEIPTCGSKENNSKSKLAATLKSLHPQMKPSDTKLVPKSKTETLPTASDAATAAVNTKGISNSRSKTDLSFTCVVCASKFSLKSLLNAHMRSHEDGTPTFVKKSLISNSASTGSTQSLSNSECKCKYCDKKFALVRALHIHLLQHCAKIPPNEKRKLQFTELNHVEKAQLPAVFHASAPQKSNSDLHSSPLVTGANVLAISSGMASLMLTKSRSNLSSGPVSSTESLIGKKDITVLANELVAAVDGVLTKMAPPSVLKSKKKHLTTAHSGVYRTPSKSVPCHLCKKSFKSILEFTNHSMTLHSTSTYTTFGNNSSGSKSSSSPMDLSST